MTAFIQSNVPVVEQLFQRFKLVDAKDVVAARLALGAQLRESMQHPETYTIPLDQPLPPGIGIDDAAKYVHPWNVACALVNLCTNMPRFGGEPIAPQEDLQLYATQWELLGSYTFPAAVVPKAEPEPEPEPVPTEQSGPSLSEMGITELPKELQPPTSGGSIEAADVDLPDPSITLPRSGQSGRPQKSPFEKKVELRKSVGKPPFWWLHVLVSARKIFDHSPAGALDGSSEGAGPVQSYMVLLALLQQALAPVDAKMTVGALREYLREIDEQVAALPSAEAINQLRSELIND